MTHHQQDSETAILIQRNLRQAFGAIEREPLPSQLTQLLERLKKQDGSYE